jgi:hypothetical protein
MSKEGAQLLLHVQPHTPFLQAFLHAEDFPPPRPNALKSLEKLCDLRLLFDSSPELVIQVSQLTWQ